ncbi:MAG: hypothetical protein Q8N21_00835 [bacterium]|nr:hypothetical protein [bacterium]
MAEKIEKSKIEHDKCVKCGGETEYPKDTRVDFREGYIEGAGQLCEDCRKKIYG